MATTKAIPIKKILDRIGLRLGKQWDENFRRQGFFGDAWPKTKRPTAHHTLLNSGHLRESIDSEIVGDELIFTSSAPYAALHNEGGSILVTARVRKAFWAQYYAAHNDTDREYYKSLALVKLGTRLTIPQRKFVGDHDRVREICKETILDELKNTFNDFKVFD